MGGSGSNVHIIDRTKIYNILDALNNSAFKDFNLDYLNGNQYYEDLLASMIDDINDTSALWGSRIVMARLIYSLLFNNDFKNANLEDSSNRKKLVNYIIKGLTETKNYFNLEKGKYGNQLILPTTLAFIKYKEETDNIKVESMWAGDSRCYALSSLGLKQISIDDEDESGAITNLFYEGNNNVNLHYKKVTLNKPCILFAASDGTFDPFSPYENFGLENLLLKCIYENNSFDEFKNSITKAFDNMHSDDASMAISIIGFHSYQELKEALLERKNYIFNLVEKFKENKNLLNILNQPKEYYYTYIVNRTNDKFKNICNKILEADECYDDPIIKRINEIITPYKEELEKERIKNENKKRIEYIDLVKLNISNEYNKISSYFNKENESIKQLIALYETFNNSKKESLNIKFDILDLDEKRKKLNDDISNLKRELDNQIRKNSSLNNQIIKYQNNCDCVLNYFRKNLKNLQKITYRINIKYDCYFMSEKINDLKNNINNVILNMKQRKNDLENYEDLVKKTSMDFQNNLNLLFSQFYKDYILFKSLLKPAKLEEINKLEEEPVIDVLKVKEKFLINNKELIINSIVECLLKNKNTIIDGFYHQSRLDDFRCYKILNDFNIELNELKIELERLIDNYISD